MPIRAQMSERQAADAKHRKQRSGPRRAAATPPTNGTPLVDRSRLIKLALSPGAPDIVVLQAPAGFGKSTLMRQIEQTLTQAGSGMTGWITLDKRDNDRRWHAEHLRQLIDALKAPTTPANGSGAPPVQDADTSKSHLQRSDWFISELLSIGDNVTLFIDEFEAVTDKSILLFWKELLHRIPKGIRIIISSRNIPEIGIARLLVGNKLLVLTSEELSFTKEETNDFFKKNIDSDLHDAEIDTIYRRSEGWPAAVQLFNLGVSYYGRHETLNDFEHGCPQALTEYLKDCVLSGLPEGDRDFLLQIAILDKLNGKLCDHVLGRDDCTLKISELEKNGLFIHPLDQDHEWHRMHGLFADLLIKENAVRRSFDPIPLHKKAAEWFFANEKYEDAIRHAVEARDYPLAAEILKRWGSILIANGEMATVARWADLIPAEYITSDTDLAVRVAWAMIFLRRRRQVRLILDSLSNADQHCKLRVVLAVSDMSSDNLKAALPRAEAAVAQFMPSDEFAAFEGATAAKIVAYGDLHRGNFNGALEGLMLARSLNEGTGASLSAGYTACFEGAVLLLEGKTLEAARCVRNGLEAQQKILDSTYLSGVLATCYLWILYERNDIDGAAEVLSEYGDILGDTTAPDFFAIGQICHSRILTIQGDGNSAKEILDKARFSAMRNDWKRIEQLLLIEQARHDRMLLTSGAVDRALSYLADMKRDNGYWVSPTEHLIAPTINILKNSCSEAQENSYSAKPPSAQECPPSNKYCMIQNHTCRAIYYYHRNDNIMAQRQLRRALDTVRSTGLIRAMMDYGQDVNNIASDIFNNYSDNDKEDYKNIFDDVFNSTYTKISKDEKPFTNEIFTSKEMEVIPYLKSPLSNKKIAREMMVSENTIKYHIKNIYAKLNVSTRNEVYSALNKLDERR
ncbi:LuxR C-terminal-related transcriptional regulator [Sphingobium sp. Cam5-1]|uniref:LuxR C-terminal-related transcriptional regulator n=1 Tax=Sphingobium sp. Cam5-1 TaxID=2789327 RepID=UPI0018AD1D07|nr:LuxR C-terminal-related transcriptional regulator [Sphingobium sp. Cam5-1]QPI72232.1 hypothetical protein IZV00_10040 [Sphingobium sp. Cam5-1]